MKRGNTRNFLTKPRKRPCPRSTRTHEKAEKFLLNSLDSKLYSNFENIRYEGFGPDKVAVIIETLTDNKNRTASGIRTIFQKHGGNLGTQGSASHNFNQVGVIKIDKKEISDDKIFELAIDSGAEECISNDDFHEIQCEKGEIYNVKKKIEKEIKNFISTEIEWKPLNNIEVSKEKIETTTNLLENLENNDDVQNVYTNLKFGKN